MSVGEKLSFASAVSAGFNAGTADFKDVVDAASVLANDKEKDVALSASRYLFFAKEDVLTTSSAQAKVSKKIVTLYQPALNTLGFVDRKNDTPQDRERRAALFGVVVEAQGPSGPGAQKPGPALAVAVAAGKELFTTGTTKKVAQDLWPAAAWAAVRFGKIDATTWTTWLAATKKTTDPRQRSFLLHALASTQDPALSPLALELVFDKDLRVNEIGAGLWAQGDAKETWDGAFAFVTGRYDELLKVIPEDWRASLPEGFSSACDDERAAKIEAFFGPKVKTTPGLERSLAQALESVRLCAAKARAHRASIEKMFPT